MCLRGIWRFHHLFSPPVCPAARVSLGEGNTPLEELFEWQGVSVLAKREDRNPTGSHKDRAFAYQVSFYKSQGHQRLLISSSGNGGISLAAYCRAAGVESYVFVHPRTERGKLRLLKNLATELFVCTKPINFARYVSRRYAIPNLRPSRDDTALEGYVSLAAELAEELEEGDELFLFATSATTLVGIAEGFRRLGRKCPPLHAVQAGPICSLAAAFHPDIVGEVGGVGERGVKNTPRKGEALEHIRASGGGSWWVSSEEVKRAEKTLRDRGILTSSEGAACLAALDKALAEGRAPSRAILLFSGHFYQTLEVETLTSLTSQLWESYSQLRGYLDELFEVKAAL